MNICEFCNKEFASERTLYNHKRNTKYCLKIQSKNGINIEYNEKLKCNICSKNFSDKRNLLNHLEKICLNGKDINILFVNNLYYEINNKNNMINELKEENIICKENIRILEKNNVELNKKLYGVLEVNKILETDRDCIHQIAKQPKTITTTTNNNNKILNVITPFNLSDKEQIIDIVKNNYNINYIFSGQKGCARFVYENIIKDTDGNLKYICSDPSRFIYKYKDEYGNIQKDIDARRLTNLLIEGGLKNKACDMASNWWTDENGDVNTDKFEMLIEKAEAIRTMEQDNTEFKKELATMTSI